MDRLLYASLGTLKRDQSLETYREGEKAARKFLAIYLIKSMVASLPE